MDPHCDASKFVNVSYDASDFVPDYAIPITWNFTEDKIFNGTVCIPCFPRDTHLLGPLLDNIDRQTILPLRVVISHSEMTSEEAKQLGASIGQNRPYQLVILNYIGKMNAAANRNRAIEWSVGEYLSWFDTDDYMFPQRLEVLAAVMENMADVQIVVHTCIPPFEKPKRREVVHVIPPHIMWNTAYNRVAQEHRVSFLLPYNAPHGVPTYRRQPPMLNHRFNATFDRGEDALFLVEALLSLDRNLTLVLEPLMHYTPADVRLKHDWGCWECPNPAATQFNLWRYFAQIEGIF